MATQTSGLHNLTYDYSCTGGPFTACLKRQTTDLSDPSLRTLRDLGLHRDLGPAVRELKIRVPLYDPSVLKRQISKTSHQKEKQDEPKKELAWLQDQQRQQEKLPASFIQKHLASIFTSLGQLETVSLDFEFVRGSNPDNATSRCESRLYSGNLLPRASQLYRLLISAIIESGISLTSLEIYTNCTQCGVPLSDLAIQTWHQAEGWAFLKDSIKIFGIRVSTAVNSPMLDLRPRDGRVVNESWTDLPPCEASAHRSTHKQELRGLVDLMNCLSSIQSFHLCLFSSNKEKRIPKSEIFEAVVQHARLPLLQDCRFGGLYTSGADLLHFLATHSHIRILSMDKIVLTSGGWKPILAHLSENLPTLKYLRLSLLYTDHEWENLNPTWEDPKKGALFSREFNEYDLARGLDFHPHNEDAKCRVSIRNFLERGPMYGHD
ncbi:hypothetical protein N7512_002414 [Penicillium capsulatum]|nr:hypothetical protein N7512_002414 [Penicillium capsulatum]